MKDLFDFANSPTMKFEEAIKYFGDKVPLTPKEFYDLADKYKSLAFTVSNYSKAGVLNRFYETLLKALEDGTSIQQFKKDMDTFLVDTGYKGLTPFQADNIFRTNIQTAYQVGHYKQMRNPQVLKLRPYWQYDAVDDRRTRPAHRAMDGKVFAADNPIWDTWYPPNGFKCRCGIKTLSQRQVDQQGLTVETKAPTAGTVNGEFVSIYPDTSFDTNPAKVEFKPDLEGYPDSIKKAYKTQQEKQP